MEENNPVLTEEEIIKLDQELEKGLQEMAKAMGTEIKEAQISSEPSL